METKQDLFKQLEAIENLFSEGSIKKAQKNLRETLSIIYFSGYYNKIISIQKNR